jgi:hypothetical protein
MPTWNELQSRVQNLSKPSVRVGTDEVLIADVRGRMTPGSFVEEKLRVALSIDRKRRRKPK